MNVGHDDVEVREVLTHLPVRWLEVDAQGVVFHMWYLAYLEDARNAHLAAVGYPLADLLASGHDLRVVSTRIDWAASLSWGQTAAVTSRVERLGETSITFRFSIEGADREVLRAQTVYVVVDRPSGVKRPIPEALRRVLVPAGRPGSDG